MTKLVDIVDFDPNDEEQLCLHVYPQHAYKQMHSLGHSWAKVHISDIAPGGRPVKGKRYHYPMSIASVCRLYYEARDTMDNILFTEGFLEEAIKLINADIAADMAMPRLKALERFAKDPNNKIADGEDTPNGLGKLKDILVSNDRGEVRSPFIDRLEYTRTPYTHQRVITEYIIALSSAGIWCDPGTGKTKATGEALQWLRRRGKIEGALIICPRSLIDTWAIELRRDTDLIPLALSQKSTTEKIRELDTLWPTSDVIIVNYESILALREWFDTNFYWPKMAVVADESTKIKNPSAKRSKALHAIGRKAGRKIALSGSPITQGAWDVYSQFLFLDGGETFGNSHKRFIDDYFFRDARFKNQIQAKPGADFTISEKMYRRGIRFRKVECLDLPEKVYSRRYVTLGAPQQEIYKRIQIDMLANFDDGVDIEITAPIILTELLRLGQITSGHVNGKRNKTEMEISLEMIANGVGFVDPQVKHTVFFKEQPKIDMLQNILQDEFPDDKMVVWTRFVPERHRIFEMLKRESISYVSFEDFDAVECQRAINEGGARVFVANPQSAAHGLTFTGAHITVYMSNTFSLEQRVQSEDRVHRIGQDQVCQYIDIVVRKSIDIHVLDSLLEKKGVADRILRDGFTNFLNSIT